MVYLKNADATKLAVTLRAALAALPGQSANAGTGVAATAGSASTTSRPSTSSLMNTGANAGNGEASQRPQHRCASGGRNQPSTGGQIQADPATNSLIISAPEPVYRELRAVIDKLDQRRAQVFVESLIAEVRTDKAAGNSAFSGERCWAGATAATSAFWAPTTGRGATASST
ncbi:MAG: secretin N-terminal domain-containing protein [Burkholderiaceae bacterium]